MAAFAISVTVSVRSHALLARNGMSEALAKGIADGMTGFSALSVSHDGGAEAAEGRWRSCRWEDGAVVWTSVQDQSGLVDLNTASPTLVAALLEGLGLAQGQAAELTSAMRDYRDADTVSDLGLPPGFASRVRWPSPTGQAPPSPSISSIQGLADRHPRKQRDSRQLSA